MRSPFDVSENSQPGEEDERLERSRWGPLVLTALMITLAACSAALLVQ
jgi:hypothetical protein